MSNNKLNDIVLPRSSKTTLKRFYKPHNPIYIFKHLILPQINKSSAILNLYESGYIKLKENSEGNKFSDFQICKLGIDKAELIIEEDRKFFIPNLFSGFAIIISGISLLLSYLTYTAYIGQ